METQTKKPTVKLSHLLHNNFKQIRLDYSYDPELIEVVKKIEGIRWSKENRCWYIYNNKENLKKIFDALKGIVSFDTTEFFPAKETNENSQVPITFQEIKTVEIDYSGLIDDYIEELEMKSYSKSTIKNHKTTITNFIDFVRNREIKETKKA